MVTLGSDAALTDHFAYVYAFVCENVTLWQRYDVQKFDAGMAPFCLEKSSVRKGIL